LRAILKGGWRDHVRLDERALVSVVGPGKRCAEEQRRARHNDIPRTGQSGFTFSNVFCRFQRAVWPGGLL
jgi:hypothetical protein